jgi:DNA-binding winged helix-turn-helix (wHTH) protein
VSESECVEVLWRSHHDGDSSAVRNAISALRAGLGLPGDDFIVTAPGEGWFIRGDE